MSSPMFPSNLNQGSSGRAVNMLGLLMKILRYGPFEEIIYDGEYSPNGKIAGAVSDFQRRWGLSINGDFDERTQAEFAKRHFPLAQFDLNMFHRPTYPAPPRQPA